MAAQVQMGNKNSPQKQATADQLRHDRMIAAAVLAVFAALIAMAIWFASLGGGAENIDYPYWLTP